MKETIVNPEAVKELSDQIFTSAGQEIANGTSLNSIETPGSYYGDLQYVSGGPQTTGYAPFNLKVFPRGDMDSRPVQLLYVYNSNIEKMYIRVKSNSTDYSAWDEFVLQSRIGKLQDYISNSAAWGGSIVIQRPSIHYGVKVTAGREGYGFILNVPKSTTEKVMFVDTGSCVTNVTVSETTITIGLRASGYGSSINYVAEIYS